MARAVAQLQSASASGTSVTLDPINDGAADVRLQFINRGQRRKQRHFVAFMIFGSK